MMVMSDEDVLLKVESRLSDHSQSTLQPQSYKFRLLRAFPKTAAEPSVLHQLFAGGPSRRKLCRHSGSVL